VVRYAQWGIVDDLCNILILAQRAEKETRHHEAASCRYTSIGFSASARGNGPVPVVRGAVGAVGSELVHTGKRNST
jgi:hypothetical protein